VRPRGSGDRTDRRFAGRTAIIAHAGTIRAALAMALGTIGPALAFSIDPLSITRLMLAGTMGHRLRQQKACP
jgi:alpha-ribazole phosphatase